MASAIEVLNHRLTALISVLVLIGMGLAFMDSRHASAMDVQDLSDMIMEDRIDRLEYDIEECEEIITDILSIPVEEQTREDLRDLNTEMNRKERLLRKLKLLMERANGYTQ